MATRQAFEAVAPLTFTIASKAISACDGSAPKEAETFKACVAVFQTLAPYLGSHDPSRIVSVPRDSVLNDVQLAKMAIVVIESVRLSVDGSNAQERELLELVNMLDSAMESATEVQVAPSTSSYYSGGHATSGSTAARRSSEKGCGTYALFVFMGAWGVPMIILLAAMLFGIDDVGDLSGFALAGGIAGGVLAWLS